MVSKMIDNFDGKQRLCGFIKNKIRYILQGFLDDTMHDIGGDM